uniref:Vitamin K-dependent protein C n=1 Tax=Pelusios castaneus TaxID=367368 RepID=A0A8C8S6C4_9SAUR
MWRFRPLWVLVAACFVHHGHGAAVFYSSKDANQILKIQKRANSFLEELKPGSLERECKEELCNLEEANEIFKTRDETLNFWTKYIDGDQCLSNPCFNGTCLDNIGRFHCICNQGWEGRLCQYAANYTNCSIFNGGCEHFCNEAPQHSAGRYCSCASGYQLMDDHSKCKPVGEYHRMRNEETEQTILVDKLVRHENYNKETSDNDIAMLHLAQPMIPNKFVLPICLPTKKLAAQELTANGKQMVVTGWGSISDNSLNYSTVLNYIEVPIVPQNTCAEAMRHDVSENMLCAGLIGDKQDACGGDSGGPMVTKFKNTWFLVGLVSWGEGCGKQEKFGVYTKVSQYLKWIHQHIRPMNISSTG